MGRINFTGDMGRHNEVIISKPDRDTGFAMTVVIAGSRENQERCRKFLMDVEQVVRDMESNGLSFQDVRKGIEMVSEMDAYFTHWRHENKHHTDKAFKAMQAEKEALLSDNEVEYRN